MLFNSPLPPLSTVAGLAYYQQPAAAQYYAAPQRMMFMRYVQPSFGTGRSHQAAAALVAGDSVATGTYLQGE